MSRLLRGMIALAVVTVLAAAWFGWTWWRVAHDDTNRLAADRETVLAAAGQALVSLNTVDYHDPAPAVDRWIQVTTGELGKNLSGDRQEQLDRATSTRTVATASLDQAAVVSLNGDAARVIAVLDVRLSTNGGPSAPSRSRLTADLTRTPGGWKVSGVQAAS
ncbi:MAG TPA: hypothetical protein VHC18_00160 [Amycolatopsis sp.]|nr:hypothetical protein [Amycolatopsis sp.]